MVSDVVGMPLQGYKQGVVCRERKGVLDGLTKLEENLGLKKT